VFGEAVVARSDWPEKIRRMADGTRYQFGFAPYQAEIYDEIANSANQVVVMCMASRLGKTEIVMNDIGWRIDQQPQRMIVAYPTEAQAQDWSKDNLQTQLIDPTPSLSDVLPNQKGARTTSNTILSKLFPGGKIDAVGLNVMGKLRKLKAPYCYADEIDAIQYSGEHEGDKLEVLFKRSDEWQNPIRILTSYPSRAGRSRIWSWLQRSDWRQWHVDCVHCAHHYVLHRDQIRWPNGQPHLAELICPSCASSITEKQWRKMVRRGSWEATQEFSGIRGYQANAMMWPHPTQDAFRSFFHQVAATVENATTSSNPRHSMQVLTNTFDAEPYDDPRESKPTSSALMRRRDDYRPLDAIPDAVQVITAGIDPNKDFIALTVAGWSWNSECYLLHYEELHGSILQSQVWRDLDDVLAQTWTHPTRGNMRVSCTCVDSNHKPDITRKWCAQRRGRRVIAIIGSNQLTTPFIGPPVKGAASVRRIGTHEGKDSIYQRLELLPDPEAETFPQGYIHFPKTERFGDAYFDGLLSEESELKQSNGEWRRWFWHPEGAARNEPLDTLVYASAAREILNPVFRGPAAPQDDDKLVSDTPPPTGEDSARQKRKAVVRRRRKPRSSFISS